MNCKAWAGMLVGALLCASSVTYAEPRPKLDLKKIKNHSVRYVRASKLKVFPLPIVYVEREGLATEAQIAEIMSKVVYPIINGSREPIAAIKIEFYPNEPRQFGVNVQWHSQRFIGQLVTRNSKGKIPADTVHSILEEETDE